MGIESVIMVILGFGLVLIWIRPFFQPPLLLNYHTESKKGLIFDDDDEQFDSLHTSSASSIGMGDSFIDDEQLFSNDESYSRFDDTTSSGIAIVHLGCGVGMDEAGNICSDTFDDSFSSFDDSFSSGMDDSFSSFDDSFSSFDDSF